MSVDLQQVARSLEFSGYGPVVVEDDHLVVQSYDNLLRLKVNDDGSLEGYPALYTYQNPLQPVVRAALNVISHIYVANGMPFFEYHFEDDLDSSGALIVRAIMLWQTNPEASPLARRKLVLHELLLRDEPVWHTTHTVPYNGSNRYYEFYNVSRAMLLDFSMKGELPVGVNKEQLEEAIFLCTPED